MIDEQRYVLAKRNRYLYQLSEIFVLKGTAKGKGICIGCAFWYSIKVWLFGKVSVILSAFWIRSRETKRYSIIRYSIKV